MTSSTVEDGLEVELPPRPFGPAANGRIEDEPVSWGSPDNFEVTGSEEKELIDRALERDRQRAEDEYNQEIDDLFVNIRMRREPTSLVHGLLVWGPLTVPQISGYLAMTVNEVEDKLSQLLLLSRVRALPAKEGQSDALPRFEVNLRGARPGPA